MRQIISLKRFSRLNIKAKRFKRAERRTDVKPLLAALALLTAAPAWASIPPDADAPIRAALSEAITLLPEVQIQLPVDAILPSGTQLAEDQSGS
jgi:hypothetical protein